MRLLSLHNLYYGTVFILHQSDADHRNHLNLMSRQMSACQAPYREIRISAFFCQGLSDQENPAEAAAGE